MIRTISHVKWVVFYQWGQKMAFFRFDQRESQCTVGENSHFGVTFDSSSKYFHQITKIFQSIYHIDSQKYLGQIKSPLWFKT